MLVLDPHLSWERRAPRLAVGHVSPGGPLTLEVPGGEPWSPVCRQEDAVYVLGLGLGLGRTLWGLSVIGPTLCAESLVVQTLSELLVLLRGLCGQVGGPGTFQLRLHSPNQCPQATGVAKS